MTENNPFNDEWNKLLNAFLNSVNARFVNPSQSATDDDYASQYEQSLFFNQWISDVDKCWHDHAEVSSTDIDSIYKKISSSSRFFINFTGSVTLKKPDETTADFIEKLLKGFETKTSSKERNREDVSSQKDKKTFDNLNYIKDLNALWKLPPAFINNQQYFLKNLSGLFENAANDSDFSAALEAYLIALQKYQLEFINLFKVSAIQIIEILNLNDGKSISSQGIMSICLEVLEDNYKLLISKESYSKTYADVVNKWMFMLSKSNIPFAEFIQSDILSAQTVNSNGPSYAK